jgi:hypothetical protein
MWGCINSTDGHGKLYTVREAGHHTTPTQRMWCETGDKGMDSHTDISDTKDGPETYTQGMAPSSLFQTMTPTNIRRTFGFGKCFLWWINAETFRYWTTLIKYVGRGGRYIRTKIGRNWWGTTCRCSKQARIAEHSTNGTNIKHENSPLVHITQAYKISALTPLATNHLHIHKGIGNRNDSLEWQGEWLGLGGNRITLRGHLFVDLKPLAISKFFFFFFAVKTWLLAVQNKGMKKRD